MVSSSICSTTNNCDTYPRSPSLWRVYCMRPCSAAAHFHHRHRRRHHHHHNACHGVSMHVRSIASHALPARVP